jgi:hypothetical protein
MTASISKRLPIRRSIKTLMIIIVDTAIIIFRKMTVSKSRAKTKFEYVKWMNILAEILKLINKKLSN